MSEEAPAVDARPAKRSRSSHQGGPIVCQVTGCTTPDLAGAPTYNLRHRICLTHFKVRFAAVPSSLPHLPRALSHGLLESYHHVACDPHLAVLLRAHAGFGPIAWMYMR